MTPRRPRSRCAAFNQEGRHLAFGFNDGSVSLWDVRAGQELFRWKPHVYRVKGFAFSADGSTLASCSSREPAVRLLKLDDLRRRLGGLGLDW